MFSIKGLLYFNTRHSVCAHCTLQFLAQFTIWLCATQRNSNRQDLQICLCLSLFPSVFHHFFFCISLSVSVAKQCGSYYRRLSVKFAEIREIRPKPAADREKLSLGPLTRLWIHYLAISVFGFIFHPVLSCLVEECHHTCFLYWWRHWVLFSPL